MTRNSLKFGLLAAVLAVASATLPGTLSAQSSALADAASVEFLYGDQAPYRDGIIKVLESEIADAQTAGSDVDVATATLDINDDGVVEVAARLESTLYCGSSGCPTILLQYTANQGWVEILKINSQGIALGDNKTAGYHDLIIDASNVWRWNGTAYSFSGAK